MWKLKSVINTPYAYAENIFTDFEMDKLAKLAKTKVAEKAQIGTVPAGETDLGIRNSSIVWIAADGESEFAFRKITDVVLELNRNFYGYDLEEFEDLQYTEYDAEYKGHYGCHKDVAYDGIMARRKLSFVIQMTEESSYEGGELLLYPNSIDNYIVAPKKRGTIIVFPSYTLHQITPVTKGIRNSLVSWVHGPAFK